jgi:ABC-type nitrate/sulfonate/bicarbonate transport system permease component
VSPRVHRLLSYAGIAAFVLALWWAISASGSVKSIVLASPSDVWKALRSLLSDPQDVLSAMWATLRPLLIAFGIAAPTGVLVGLVIGRSRLLRDAYEPLLANLNTVPVIVLYPLLAGMIGLGALPQVVVGALAAFFPIAIASVWAARQVEQNLLTAARAMGASRWELTASVALPAALPGVLSGMRTGLGLAFVTIIAGEFISSTEGLGYELAEMSQAFRTPELFAWVVVTLVFSALLNGAWSLVQGQIERSVRR